MLKQPNNTHEHKKTAYNHQEKKAEIKPTSYLLAILNSVCKC